MRVGENGCSVYRKVRKKTVISKKCPYRTVMSPASHREKVGTQVSLENVVQQLCGHWTAMCQPLTLVPILGPSLEEATECG